MQVIIFVLYLGILSFRFRGYLIWLPSKVLFVFLKIQTWFLILIDNSAFLFFKMNDLLSCVPLQKNIKNSSLKTFTLKVWQVKKTIDRCGINLRKQIQECYCYGWYERMNGWTGIGIEGSIMCTYGIFK